ncbi:MAG: sigma-54 dependent transcriptional regulator [Succinivibrionaceae bacterium]|nr:sigma-54 dependent transcriptional regulator [Succinivibrionaceae bacterium]
MTPDTENMITILIVEDALPLAKLYETVLKSDRVKALSTGLGRDAMRMIKELSPDIVLLDLHLPDMPGMDILRSINEQELDISVIVMTANGSVNFAVEAMRLGAYDFLEKPIDPNRLRTTIGNTIEKRKLNALITSYKFEQEDNPGDFIGNSPAMQEVYNKIRRIKNSRATVFITGESGTGKEVTALAVHKQNTERNGPFVPINCAAIPHELMESEIFGHVKGAFTGANTERQGAVALADGGTLFLDELCEMDLDLQSKFLRFIQSSRYKKVGGSKFEEVDIRIICATNRNPLEEVKAGRFREDLFYRLYVVPIHLPPLRERDGDCVLLANHFLHYYSNLEKKNFENISREAERFLMRYNWPGNVRQLQNLIYRIVVLNDGRVLTKAMLAQEIGMLPEEFVASNTQNSNLSQDKNVLAQQPLSGNLKPDNQVWPKTQEVSSQARCDVASGALGPEAAQASDSALIPAVTNDGIKVMVREAGDCFELMRSLNGVVDLETIERKYILAIVRLCDGSVVKAAGILGVNSSTLYRKLEKWKKQGLVVKKIEFVAQHQS